MSVQPDDVLVDLCRIATEAGRKILPFFQKSFTHQLKSDNSPVTEADLAAHEHLAKALNQLNPQRVIISEESTASHSLSDSVTEDYWLIDPLDGTKEFMKGKREFTVNVALIRDRRPVLGVVHAPVLGVSYFARASEGAWRQAGADPPVPIQARRANVQHLTVWLRRTRCRVLRPASTLTTHSPSAECWTVITKDRLVALIVEMQVFRSVTSAGANHWTTQVLLIYFLAE